MMMAMMGWGSSSSSNGWRKGPWTPEEDKLLAEYVRLHGEGRWSSVSRSSGVNRSGKSCRLRWVNYLRPGLKRSQITPQEEGIIIELHALWGNKWSTIARYLPGRTDNEIKNYWRTHFKKKEKTSNLKQEKRKAQLLDHKAQIQLQLQQQQQQPLQYANSSTDQDTTSNTDQTTDQAAETVAAVAHPIVDAQCFPAVMTQDAISAWSQFLGEDALLLEGLWNWDETNTPTDHSTNCSKIAVPNQAVGTFVYGVGGDSFGNTGGYHMY